MEAQTINKQQTKDVPDEIQQQVKALLEASQSDFSQDQLQKIKPKVDDLNKQLDLEIEAPATSKTRKAKLLQFKGEVLDILPDYTKLAQDSLSQSIKLNHLDAETWNTLGHVLWKKRDFDGARSTYENAITQCGKNKRSLRELSIVLRCTGAGQERKANVEQSVVLAKEAVAMDMQDGESWYILGNAYMSNFFVNFQSIQEIRTALQSYNQAENYSQDQKNPDLHYNRANIHTYLLDYDNAISEYKKAHKLDEGLKSDQMIMKLTEQFKQASLLVSNNGKIQSKKLANMVKTIPNSLKSQPQQFGNLSYEIVPLQSMKQGINQGVIHTCKVTNVLSKKGDVPATFIIVDYYSQFGSLCVYNSSDEIYQQIRQASDIYILDPVLKLIKISDSEENQENSNLLPYRAIQVFELEQLYVDNAQISNTYSPSVVVNETFQN